MTTCSTGDFLVEEVEEDDCWEKQARQFATSELSCGNEQELWSGFRHESQRSVVSALQTTQADAVARVDREADLEGGFPANLIDRLVTDGFCVDVCPTRTLVEDEQEGQHEGSELSC